MLICAFVSDKQSGNGTRLRARVAARKCCCACGPIPLCVCALMGARATVRVPAYTWLYVAC